MSVPAGLARVKGDSLPRTSATAAEVVPPIADPDDAKVVVAATGMDENGEAATLCRYAYKVSAA